MITRRRPGARPRTSTSGPHRQLDQQSPPAIWGELIARVFDLPGVQEGISQVSPASSRAVFLADHTVERSAQTSLAPGRRPEPVHVHGVHDTSSHLVLPTDRGAELVGLGWAEEHQHAEFGTEFMLYGPRDHPELEFAVSVIEESLAFARGDGT